MVDPPLDTPVLIFEPKTLGSSWYFAMRTRVRGAKEPRWKIYAWRDRMASLRRRRTIPADSIGCRSNRRSTDIVRAFQIPKPAPNAKR